MARVTVTIDDEHETILEELSGEEGPYPSKSAAVRDLIEQYDSMRTELTECEERIEELETERDNLRKQLQAANARYDQHTELVEFVEEEKQAKARRREREHANILTRTKWSIFGRPRPDAEASE